MEENINKFDLTSFKKSNKGMIATNDSAYKGGWGVGKYEGKLKGYSPEEIERIINSGSLESQQKLSRNYFHKNGFYKRLIIYYATLLKYTGLLIPNPSFGKSLSTSHIQKRYFNAVDFIDQLSLPVLFTGFAQRALVDGCYFGLIKNLEKSDFAILDLPSAWCRTAFKDMSGNDIIEFDLSYFNSIALETERKKALDVYPEFVAEAYWLFNKGKRKSKWLFIPSEIGVCFPFFDSRPLFLSTIPTTIKHEEAVELELERDWEEIKKILVQKVPHLTDGRLLFEPPEAEEMHTGAVGMLKGNKNISVLTTYADVEAVSSKTASEASSHSLDNMVQNIYNEAGVSGELFASNGSNTLEASIKNDTALMMVLGNKFGLFITNLVNRLYGNSNINFKYTMLPITYYNEDKFIDSTFKLASSGYSFLLPAIASGLSQKDLSNIKDLENDVLGLKDKLIPLSSSYTESGEEEGGAPKKKEEDKTDKTIQNEESLDKQ